MTSNTGKPGVGPAGGEVLSPSAYNKIIAVLGGLLPFIAAGCGQAHNTGGSVRPAVPISSESQESYTLQALKQIPDPYNHIGEYNGVRTACVGRTLNPSDGMRYARERAIKEWILARRPELTKCFVENDEQIAIMDRASEDQFVAYMARKIGFADMYTGKNGGATCKAVQPRSWEELQSKCGL